MSRRPAADTAAVVVGVARDTDVRWIYTDRRALVYLPLSQHFASGITLTARSTGAASRAVPALREAIRKGDPDVAVTAIGTASSLLAGPFVIVGSLGRGALYLGGLSLLLSMVGLFGVQSHVVAHRTREIGVRMSVGASARQIKLMVLKDGYRPVIEGLILGLWGGVAGRLIMRSYMELDRRHHRRSVDAVPDADPADRRCILRVLSAGVARCECRSDGGATLRIIISVRSTRSCRVCEGNACRSGTDPAAAHPAP